MAQIALGLKKKTLDEKLVLTSTLVTNMTGNANFTTPKPPLADLTAKASAIADKRADIAATLAQVDTQTLELAQLESELEDLLTSEGKYIENTTNGDPIKMASAGVPLKGASSPIGELAAPENLRLSIGDQDGEIDAMWDARRGANTYLGRHSTTANGPWTQGYAGTISKCTFTGLTSGTEYFVQVCAIGTAGQSPWSDIARKRAA